MNNEHTQRIERAMANYAEDYQLDYDTCLKHAMDMYKHNFHFISDDIGEVNYIFDYNDAHGEAVTKAQNFVDCDEWFEMKEYLEQVSGSDILSNDDDNEYDEAYHEFLSIVSIEVKRQYIEMFKDRVRNSLHID